MKPLVLSPAQQAEAVDHVLAVRQLGLEMLAIFGESGGKSAANARRGAEAMIQSLNRLLELLDAPPDLYAGGDG